MVNSRLRQVLTNALGPANSLRLGMSPWNELILPPTQEPGQHLLGRASM